MRSLLFIALMLITIIVAAQSSRRLPAQRTTATFKIDGNLDEQGWKGISPANQFIELKPSFGRKEEDATRTEVYIVYDNTAIYIGGYCHERTRDSISRELVGRDVVGVNDFVGIVFDTYNDKINAFGFYVTALGEQYDAKYSTNGEDGSWNAVWDSESRIHADGWSFEMRIPYSALRFSNQANQTWGLNITRRRNKSGQQFTWNPTDPKINGFVNQEGVWSGIEKIQTPLRLSFSPYLSAYVNHYPNHDASKKDISTSINGGMDIKYGINDAFTLDMTLVPDFGQIQSDNKVLNLSPYEVKYSENRSFFTEGTELFNKGNLFYSRRVGGQPLHYWDIKESISKPDTITFNPVESKLINAVKISGRTKGGLGIGFFNAITKPMYAEVENLNDKTIRKAETSPLTNYNIIVLDQTLKNNSSISFINTGTLRSGADYDADVSAALFNFNNKKNTYNWNGKFSISHISYGAGTNGSTGYSHNLGFGKSGGRWNFNISQEIADAYYSINDMGLQNTNNYIDHYFWSGYKWLSPTKWYNNLNLNFNSNYSLLFRPFTNQKSISHFQSFNTNINVDAQLKNLWNVGAFIGYVPEGNDFYEPRHTEKGWSYRSTERMQYELWFQTNKAKKYSLNVDFFTGLRRQFHSNNYSINIGNSYRFSDKFSVQHNIFLNPITNDAGYYSDYYLKDTNGNEMKDANGHSILENIIFSRRDRMTVENILNIKYSFNNKSGITFRVRHYWSKVEHKQFYDLQKDGTLQRTGYTDIDIQNQNLNLFNIDAVYTLQFAPGSFINIVWKEASQKGEDDVTPSYFKNVSNVFASPQNNNLSIKILYYLDYLSLKKKSIK